MDILLLIFGFLFSWLMLTKQAREQRYEKKSSLYEELSKKLTHLYLLRIKSEKFPAEYSLEYAKDRMDVLAFVLINKLVISEKVNNSSTIFVNAHKQDTDIMRSALNIAINSMRKELGLNKIDLINQLLRIEPSLEIASDAIKKIVTKK